MSIVAWCCWATGFVNSILVQSKPSGNTTINETADNDSNDNNVPAGGGSIYVDNSGAASRSKCDVLSLLLAVDHFCIK